MTQLFLLPNQIHTKMLKFIEQFLSNQGLDFRVLESQNEALECFSGKRKALRSIKPIKIKNYLLNPDNQSLTIHGIEIFLRKKEFNLLHFMLINNGSVIDRTTILERVWGVKSNPFTNTVDVHMSHLRKKLVEKNINIIKTVHSVGYKLEI